MPSVPPVPVYYQPREQVGPGIVLAVPVGVVLGIVYGFVSCLVTQVFEEAPLFVVATPVFGGAIAAASRWIADRGQVRTRRARLALAIVTSVIAMHAGWQAYLVLCDLRIFSFTPSWMMSPAHLVRGLVELAAANGRWSWLWWLLEAGIVVGMVVYLMRTVDIEVPFCDTCHAWTKVVVSFELSGHDVIAAQERLLAGDAPALATLEPRPRGDDDYAVVRVYRCACGTSRYVSLDRAHRDAGHRAGVRTYHAPGSRPSLYFDPGSGATTDLTPVVTNLQIDEATEQALGVVRDELARRHRASS